MPFRPLALCSLTALVAGCSDSTGPAAGCRQTSEFGNFGCARVQGTVRNAAGAPLAGVRVTLRPLAGAPNPYDSPAHDTDASGQYALEIHTYDSASLPTLPDTVAMYVHAFRLDTQVPIGDSVLVNAIFAPVGEVPQVVTVDLALN